MAKQCMRLHVLGLGIALGIMWGFSILILGLCAMYLNMGTQLVGAFGSIYIGYEATVMGSLIGTIWGLADGFIGGVILAWIYNCVTRCCCGSCKSEE